MKQRMRRSLISAGVLLAVVAVCFLLAFATTLSQVKFTDVKIKQISLAENGLLVMAEYGVRNDGLFTVELEEVTYTVRLLETEEALGSGTLAGEPLPPDVTTKLDATIPIIWEPTAQSIATLYTKGSATLVLDGVAHVKAGPLTVDSPFTTSINITSFAQQYAQQQQENFLRQLGLGG